MEQEVIRQFTGGYQVIIRQLQMKDGCPLWGNAGARIIVCSHDGTSLPHPAGLSPVLTIG